MNETSESSSISHETISRRAEEIWRHYGCPQGRDDEIWLEAEGQLRSEQQQTKVPAAEKMASKVTLSTPPTSAKNEPSARTSSKESELMEKNSSGSVSSRSKARAGKSR